MTVTKNLAEHINRLGINLSELSRKTGIPYQSLYRSLGRTVHARELRADELASVCLVIGVNPMDFAERKTAELCKSDTGL